MGWVIEKAKNGMDTLKVNDIYIYSKYNPLEDTNRFINTLEKQDFFVVFGLGLGYHIQLLIEKFPDAEIYGYPLSTEDLNIFKKYRKNLLRDVQIISDINEIDLNEGNLVIPIQWTKALGNHQLTPLFENIKLRQFSRNDWIAKLNSNFQYTSALPLYNVSKLEGIMNGKTICLVSSGPSLNETIQYLKKCKNKCFILAVSSCLRILIENDITPDAIIISDAKPFVKNHFSNIAINVPMFYLSTASKEAIEIYDGIKIKLFQDGYELAEQNAQKFKQPIFDVGGSVATLAFSLAVYLGFENIILFGQDLGFREGRTHAASASSGIRINQPYNYKKIRANDGEMNNASRSLYLYWRWFNEKVPLVKANVFNTALQGSAIANAKYITPEDLMKLVEENVTTNFEQLLKESLEEL